MSLRCLPPLRSDSNLILFSVMLFIVRKKRDARFKYYCSFYLYFFFSSRRRHTRFKCDWSSDVCSSDLTPENAILILVGDFDATSMQRSAEKVFGNWTGKKPAALESAKPPVPKGRRVYLVDLPGSVQTQIICGCHAITRQNPDWIKLGLTNSLYGGAFNSRLVMNIREDKGYTYSPRSGVNPLRQYGYFSVSAAVRNDVVAASLTEIFYELDKLRALPVPEPELADTRH